MLDAVSTFVFGISGTYIEFCDDSRGVWREECVERDVDEDLADLELIDRRLALANVPRNEVSGSETLLSLLATASNHKISASSCAITWT